MNKLNPETDLRLNGEALLVAQDGSFLHFDLGATGYRLAVSFVKDAVLGALWMGVVLKDYAPDDAYGDHRHVLDAEGAIRVLSSFSLGEVIDMACNAARQPASSEEEE